MTGTVIFDVDGTLVDSNYQHALAWYRSLRSVDVTIPLWQIHRAIGMGGDKLVAHVAGDEVEKEHGEELRKRWQQEFEPLIPEIAAFEDARSTLQALKDAGFTIVLASSGEKEQVEAFLKLFDGERLADAWTTSADAENSKPSPDLVEIAMKKARSKDAVMVGDSIWDCAAAERAGIPTITVLTGGFSEQELRDSGAVKVLHNLSELTKLVGQVPLGKPTT